VASVRIPSPDFVSPGEADWALCTPNPAIYQGRVDFGRADGLEQFGGVSQSASPTRASWH
jgi:hypothetical protein